MTRLITIDARQAMPPSLEVQPGDLVVLEASGAHQRDGALVACLLGVFAHSVVGTNQRVLTPEGPPNAVVIHALEPGVAHFVVVTGDPWRDTRTLPFTLIVCHSDSPAGRADRETFRR